MTRDQLAEMGREVLRILQAGYYTAPNGGRVDIAEAVRAARDGSRLYRPGDFDSWTISGSAGSTVIEVIEEGTLDAAQRLATEPGCDPCCLNFASARHPGGGFLSGARAQEETLARASGLVACIEPMREMYEYNRARSTCLYSDYMIYSPRVPVFRAGSGQFLEAPYFASFITAPAVNAGAVKEHERHLIEPTMRSRLEKVLRVAHRHGHQTLVLGAWGCGAFRNHPPMVVAHFRELLHEGGLFHNVFGRVVFAVLDFTAEQDTLSAFRTLQPEEGRGAR